MDISSQKDVRILRVTVILPLELNGGTKNTKRVKHMTAPQRLYNTPDFEGVPKVPLPR